MEQEQEGANAHGPQRASPKHPNLKFVRPSQTVPFSTCFDTPQLANLSTKFCLAPKQPTTRNKEQEQEGANAHGPQRASPKHPNLKFARPSPNCSPSQLVLTRLNWQISQSSFVLRQTTDTRDREQEPEGANAHGPQRASPTHPNLKFARPSPHCSPLSLSDQNKTKTFTLPNVSQTSFATVSLTGLFLSRGAL
jgi:hypothetical protein